jgi:hypothetical protein
MRTSFAVLLTLMCFACTSNEAGLTETSSPVADTSLGRRVEIMSTPVPLNPRDPMQTAIGAFGYAGGIELRGVDTTRLHGLSDLRVGLDGRLMAITDEGDLLEAQIVLDAAGHVVGLTNTRLTRLLDLSGRPSVRSGDRSQRITRFTTRRPSAKVRTTKRLRTSVRPQRTPSTVRSTPDCSPRSGPVN